jgi:outer membrane lipoprotein-sorting protein
MKLNMKIAAGILTLATVWPAQGLTPDEIIQKVQEKYKSLSSYSAAGKTVSVIDLSGVDASGLPGASDSIIKDSKEYKEAMGKPQTLTHTFTIKLGRPDFYRIEWEQSIYATFSNKGAVWSAGEGDFLLIGEKNYSKLNSRELALASATGISGGAAHTTPSIFFDTQNNLLKRATNFSPLNDEKIENDDCYVVTGNMAGQKIIFWISKENFLIRQRQNVFGNPSTLPELSDDAIKDSLKQLNKEATPAAIAEMRKTMQLAKAVTSQMKGTMTETHQNISINQPIAKEEFKYPLPAGLKPAPSPF